MEIWQLTCDFRPFSDRFSTVLATEWVVFSFSPWLRGYRGRYAYTYGNLPPLPAGDTI